MHVGHSRLVNAIAFAVVGALVGAQSMSSVNQTRVAITSESKAFQQGVGRSTHTSHPIIHEKLKATLDFVAATIDHTLLESDDRESLKFLHTDSSVQDQLKTLATNVKNKLVEIQATSFVDRDGPDQPDDWRRLESDGLKRRQHVSKAATVDIFRVADFDSSQVSYHVDSVDSNTRRRIKNVFNFGAMTLQNSLQTFGGSAYQKLKASSLVQVQLQSLASSVKTQLDTLAHALTELSHRDAQTTFLQVWAVITGLFLSLLLLFNGVYELDLLIVVSFVHLLALLVALGLR